MVQVVVLSANGERRTLKTSAFAAGGATGALVAKALRKAKPAVLVGTYKYKEQTLTLWGWKDGKAGTENKHELPTLASAEDAPLLFGDAVLVGAGDFTEEQYAVFYDEAFGGFEDLGDDADADEDDEEEEEEEDEGDDEEDGDAEEEEDEEEEDDEEEDEEEEEEEEDEDDDCYDDGDENGGGSKRRAPRRRTIASPECRRMDMGLRARVKLPTPIGKRAPRWQTAPELEAEEYE
jgi:hypothetical protein